MFQGLLKTFRILTVRQKLIFTICGGTILTVVLTSAIILHQASRLIEHELINKGTIIATGLSKQCIEPIMHDDIWEIYKSIKSITTDARMPFLKYIAVLDRAGRILAHSHPLHYRVGDYLPEEAFHERALQTKETLIQRVKTSRSENVFDIAVPCKIGSEKLGLIRVGLTDSVMREELAVIKRDIFLFAFLLSLGGIGVGVFVAYRITGPLNKVTQNILKISRGELGDVFPIKTEEKDEIGRMVEIFNEMARNLKTQKEMDDYIARKDKLLMLGEFSAGIAHEIKNPLTSIKMLMQASKEKDNPLCIKDIEIIEGEINRIDRIVKDFLAFAKPVQADCTGTDINDILREVVALIRSELEQLHIRLVEHFSNGIPKIIAHPDSLKQVILNIVLNAVEAMKDGGKLTILSSIGNGSVTVSISDTGSGIDDKDLGHIFDPFFTTRKDGTGMGLAIADRIVREYKGHITVDTSFGKGTTFSVVLPL